MGATYRNVTLLGTTKHVLDGRRRQGTCHDVLITTEHPFSLYDSDMTDAVMAFYGDTFDPSVDRFEGLTFFGGGDDRFYFTRSEVEDFTGLDLTAYEKYMKADDRLRTDPFASVLTWRKRR